MKAPHLLLVGVNPNQLVSQLANLLSAPSKQAIEAELRNNAAQLYRLALKHFTFASSLNNRHWRQRVSRFYYAAYNANKAVRLQNSGDYSREVSDHKKVSELPNGFPQRQKYENQLPLLRTDRNLADYDHTGKMTDLAEHPNDWRVLVGEFLADVKAFLICKGVVL